MNQFMVNQYFATENDMTLIQSNHFDNYQVLIFFLILKAGFLKSPAAITARIK